MPSPLSKVRNVLLALIITHLGGIGLALSLQAGGQTDRSEGVNAFFYLFGENEPLACAINLLLLGVGVVAVRYVKPVRNWISVTSHPWSLWAAGAVVTLICSIGTFLVFQNYLLSQDEYSLDYQSILFAHGRLFAQVPEELISVGPWVTGGFLSADHQAHTLTSWYLPVGAAVRALFQFFQIPWLCNPLLAGLSMVLYGKICQRIWPTDSAMKWLPILLLGSSAQVLITSMTAYSMPAHLTFNLVWLWLWIRRATWSWMLASLVGVLAIGLHQPHVHLLFAFPFCLRLIRDRQWAWATYFLLVYLAATAGWMKWYTLISPSALVHSEMFALPQFKQLLIQSMNIVYLFSWHSLAVGALVSLAVLLFRRQHAVIQDAGLSCLITLGFHVCFNATQGHGWGERYFYGTIGCWLLLAAAGWQPLVERCGETVAQAWTFALCLGSLLIAFPVRSWQAAEFAKPFATANRAISQVNAECILLPRVAVWYSNDLIRNDPFFKNRPLRATADLLGPDQLSVLNARGRLLKVAPSTLERFGLVPLSPAARERIEQVAFSRQQGH